MAVDVAGFEMVQAPLGKGPVFPWKENRHLGEDPGVVKSIKFGSHEDEPTEEGNVIEQGSDIVREKEGNEIEQGDEIEHEKEGNLIEQGNDFEHGREGNEIEQGNEIEHEPTEVGIEIEPTEVGNEIEPTEGGNEIEVTELGNEIEPTEVGDEIEPTKEGNELSDCSARKDAVEDWPAPKQIHYFYLVKFRPCEDPKIMCRMDQLNKEVIEKNKTRSVLTEAIKAKRSERSELISQRNTLRDSNRQLQSILDEKRKEIEPLQQALGKLRTPSNAGWGGLCSSEEELNNIIYGLQYRIQHETIPLSEEKQLLREIKQLKGTREKVIANASIRAKLQESLGQKEAIQDQVKLIGRDLDGVKKEREIVRSKIKELDNSLEVLVNDIQSLRDKLAGVFQKRDEAYESIKLLRKQRDEGNSCVYQNRALLNKARELAAKKDVKALGELSRAEDEKFMSLWRSDKTFRNDYERRILPSLDYRQLSRDGRIRNPNEKPLIEQSKPVETDTMPKISKNQLKEELITSSKDSLPSHKVLQEEPKSSPKDSLPKQKVKKEAKNKERDLKSHPESKELAEVDELEFEKPIKENVVKEPEIDPAKLKKMKREEQIAKMNQAKERKAKLADKAAARAAVRAQKEAEKKLKAREKKVKKAAAASAPDPIPEEPSNAEVEATEPRKLDENEDDASVAVKEKVQKESSLRSRGQQTKGLVSIPKVILKKRSNNYWVWFASAALLLLLLVVLGYYYLY